MFKTAFFNAKVPPPYLKWAGIANIYSFSAAPSVLRERIQNKPMQIIRVIQTRKYNRINTDVLIQACKYERINTNGYRQ